MELSKFDRLYGGLVDIALFSRPSTVKNVQAITGKTETFVIQTVRHEGKDTIFLEVMDESGLVRVALPAKVANVIALQREALSKRQRSINSKAIMAARKAAGEVIGFARKTS